MPQSAASLAQKVLVLGVIFASFALYATVRSPIPGVNEPHYLCKAKQVWNPDWCARDLFLQSANAHAVYLWGIGGLTRFLPLEQTAWVGRLAVWLALALGWTAMATRVLPGAWAAVWSAWAYLTLASMASFSGEWIIGGVEAKGFSYACVFAAIGAASVRSWNRAGILTGLAIALHPVVGGWALIAGLFAIACDGRVRLAFHRLTRSQRRRCASPSRGGTVAVGSRLNEPVRDTDQLGNRAASGLLRDAGAPLLLLTVCALPGLVPAVSMLFDSPSASVSHAADALQVYFRLDHHLNPRSFPGASYLIYAALLAGWLGLRRLAPRSPAETFFARFVGGSILIAAVGLLIGWTTDSPGILKFYPFRLFDVLLPIACALAAARVAIRLIEVTTRSATATGNGRLLGTACFAGVLAVALFRPAPDSDPSQLPPARRQDWIEACRWIDRELPPQALFLTLRYNFGFKWYARRAEYVAFKDCPQDARSLVEWKRRLDQIQAWRQRHYVRGFTDKALAELGRETGIEYAIAWRIVQKNGTIVDPFRQTPLYVNGSFAVYAVPKQAH